MAKAAGLSAKQVELLGRLKRTAALRGFSLVGVLDLSVMKLAAIARRGLRRDFWDLFVLTHQGGVGLDEVLKAYRKRYRTSASDAYHLIRALAYFEDAERDDPRLIGLTVAEWKVIRAFFANESARLLKR